MSDFPSLDTPAIIALKGLPITGKTNLAMLTAKWARTTVLFIEDFLTLEPTPQSKDEAECHAFSLLCRVAKRQTSRSKVNCVVIKSRLCSTFEFDQLMELMTKAEFHALLIIECQLSNEYRRRLWFRSAISDVSWYNPTSWNEVEKASGEYDAQAWDCHFKRSIAKLPNNKRHLIKRLVLDLSSTISALVASDDLDGSNSPFANVIRYLLPEEALCELPNTLEFDEVRREILERELNTPRERSKHLCRDERGCVFKYREALECDSRCGACEKLVFGPVYACYYCTLVLHKSCAEEPKMVSTPNATPYWDWDQFSTEDEWSRNQLYVFNEEHACNFCKKSGKSFSYGCKSCLFQTHLKCRVMPTIVNHACHPEHFLAIWFKPFVPIKKFTFHTPCRGCFMGCFFNGYVCVICNYNYHIRCLAIPGEVKHEHGGYEHVMKLMCSYDGMEEQEDIWCDVCYGDMNPSEWFYRCKECPYYVSHLDKGRQRTPCMEY